MDEIPTDLRGQLEDRIRDLTAAEVRGDVSAVYGFTLPDIRARRVAERDDEPGLSLSQIGRFVALVREAEVLSIQVERFDPSVERFSGCPAAVVVTRVRYNQRSEASQFRCIWVNSDGIWFTTSLGKVWLGTPLDAGPSQPTGPA
jgi:hypothetical protein